MKLPRAAWDGEGSWHFPYNEQRKSEWYFTHRRLLLDWNDVYAPRRLYYFGKRLDVTIALERGGTSQRYLWLRRRWDTKLKHGTWLLVAPSTRKRYERGLSQPQAEESVALSDANEYDVNDDD